MTVDPYTKPSKELSSEGLLGFGEHLPFPDETFDFATIFYVLHHCDNPAELLREVGRIVKTDGWVVIREETLRFPGQEVLTRMTEEVGNRRLHPESTRENWVKQVRHLTMEQVRVALAINSLQLVREEIFSHNPWWQGLYKTRKHVLVCQKKAG